MTERPPARASAPNFCAQCGARLQAGARFCSGCGRALGAPLAAAGGRSLRELAPGLAVLTLFLVVGLGIWVSVLRPGTTTARAPASPVAPAGAPGAGPAGGMPPDHPPIALPAEAKKFVDTLAEKAAAAPNDLDTWKSLAQVQARAGEVEPSYRAQAAESYRHVLGLAPDDPDAVQGLGNLYYDQQRFADAAEQYERYLALRPDDPNVRTDLGTAYLYQRQVERAIDIYEKVLKDRPDFLQAHFNLGLAYEAKNDRAQALASLGKARELATDDATRGQIDRVLAQLKGAGPAVPGVPETLAQAGGGSGAAGGPAADAPPAAGAGAGGGSFHGDVEAGLRSHPIIGRKIKTIEWLDATHARVLVTDFPMQAMPENIRGLFRGRLETVLDDAKTKRGVSDETGIEIVDAASGTSMERVTH